MNQAIAVPARRSLDNIAFIKPAITVKELKSVLDCIFHDEISFGKIAKKLESECSRSFGFKNSLVVSSLHSAYHLAFLAFGLREGDEVIMPSTAPLAALDAIGYLKAVPVILDLAKESFHPDLEALTKKITPQTKVILLQYKFGSFKNYSQLYEKLKNHKRAIHILQDISEIPGSSFSGQKIGTDADMAVLSLEKSMPVTMGKGSVLFTNSGQLYQIANDLRNPATSVGRSYRVRYDYTITDYQAAMGIEQLSKLPVLLEQRKKIAKIYLQAVERSSLRTYFSYPESDGYGSFPVVFPQDAKEVMTYLKKKNMETCRILTHEPLHRLVQLSPLDFPNAERLYEKSILLPIYPHLTQSSIQTIAASIKNIPHL